MTSVLCLLVGIAALVWIWAVWFAVDDPNEREVNDGLA